MVDRDDNVRVLYANENAGKRNLYLNYRDNDWNENCRFPSSRNFLSPSDAMRAPAFTRQERFAEVAFARHRAFCLLLLGV